jgi:hypothetical protein
VTSKKEVDTICSAKAWFSQNLSTTTNNKQLEEQQQTQTHMQKVIVENLWKTV